MLIQGVFLIIFGLVYLAVLLVGLAVAYHARKFGLSGDPRWSVFTLFFVLASAAAFIFNFSLLISIFKNG